MATNNIITNLSVTTNTLPDLGPYNGFRAPTSPYSMYNNQDRFLNVVYRYFTMNGLTDLLKVNGFTSVDFQDKIKFQYEKQTNLLSQHNWSYTSLLGLGYVTNASGDLGSSDESKAAIAAATISRQILNATIESALMLGNGWRYSDKMRPAINFIDSQAAIKNAEYQVNMKNLRGIMGATGGVLFTANGLVSMGLAGKRLGDAIKSGDKIEIAAQSLNALASTTGTAANLLKGLQSIGGLTKMSENLKGNLGIGGSVLGLANGLTSIVSILPYLGKAELTAEEKAILGVEAGVQFVGGLTQAASNLVLAMRVGQGLTTTSAVMGPMLGAALGALLLSLSPLEIYGLVKQSEYADKLLELGKEMSKHGYDGDSLLGQLYKDKTEAEAGIVAATTALGLIGTGVSIVTNAGGITAPVGVVVSLVTGALSGILKGVQQVIIEKIARDYAEKIKNAGGSHDYFAKNISARYAQMIDSVKTQEAIAEIQKSFDVDSVLGVTTTKLSKQL